MKNLIDEELINQAAGFSCGCDKCLARVEPPRRELLSRLERGRKAIEAMEMAVCEKHPIHRALKAEAELAKAKEELSEWELSFELFHEAIARGTNMFREAHPEYKERMEVPSTDKLVMWLLEELTELREQNKVLREEENVSYLRELKENAELRERLKEWLPVMEGHAEASHLLEGFNRKVNKWDIRLEAIKAACEGK